MSKMKLQTRPDKLVIPKDILRALPDKLAKSLFGNDEEKALAKLPPLITVALELFKEHNKYNTNLKLVPVLEDHQLATDKVIALSVLPKAVPDANRWRLLAELVLNAERSNRGSYQFIREFLRCNLAPMLHQRGIPLNVAKKLFPPDVQEFYEVGGLAGCAGRLRNACVKVMPEFAKGIATGVGIAVGTKAGKYILENGPELVELACQWFCLKGEFTHFEEVFPALKAIAEADLPGAITIGVGLEKRYKEIAAKIDKEAPGIHLQHRQTKAFRYYILPDEYIVLMGGDGQFMTFHGKTNNVSDCAARLISIDFGDGFPQITVSE